MLLSYFPVFQRALRKWFGELAPTPEKLRKTKPGSFSAERTVGTEMAEEILLCGEVELDHVIGQKPLQQPY